MLSRYSPLFGNIGNVVRVADSKVGSKAVKRVGLGFARAGRRGLQGMPEAKALTKLKIVVEYDGTNYSGWATSPSNPKESIQEVITRAFQKLFPQTSFLQVLASSRTDAGVSALGQVITVASDIIFSDQEVPSTSVKGTSAERKKAKKLAKKNGAALRESEINSQPGTAAQLYQRLNNYLPPEIVLHSSKQVPLDFDARAASLRRMYRYQILNADLRPAVSRHHHWWIKQSLDIEAMEKCARMFEGTHDMACFCPSSYHPEDPAETVRSIETSRLLVSDDKRHLTYEVVGKSFMYKQVRNMVGMITAVGMHKISLDEIAMILKKGTREPIQGAPAHGLLLVWVEHSEEAQRMPDANPL